MVRGLGCAVAPVLVLAACSRSGYGTEDVGAGDEADTPENSRLGLGVSSSCLVTAGNIECWGNNEQGQLGGGPLLPNQRFTISSLVDPVQVVSGEHFACALLGDGTVQCWGVNDQGQLGDGTTTPRGEPGPVIRLSEVDAITAGTGLHTCARRQDATVVCWGKNEDAQLGSSDVLFSATPLVVPELTDVVQISAGYEHTCAVRSDGQLWCWGSNAFGRLGDGTTDVRTAPVQVEGLPSAVEVAAGFHHTCALDIEQHVHCWGNSDFSVLGPNGSGDELTPVAVPDLTGVNTLRSGFQHICVLDLSTRVRCWGRNDSGQLGMDAFGEHDSPQVVVGIDGVVELSLGIHHGCARTASNIWCWGYNVHGQVEPDDAREEITAPLWLGQS